MRIGASITIPDAEKHLLEMGQLDQELVVPTVLKHAALGGEAALVQLIISWALTRTQARLKIFARQDDALTEFVRRLHGLVAALCADTARDFDTDQDVKSELFRRALDQLDELQGPKPGAATRGIGLDIICADHLNRNRPLMVYHRGEMPGPEEQDLRTESEFRGIARTIIASAVPEKHRHLFSRSDTEAIGSILYETFRNTGEHAVNDYEGKALKKSIRGFRCRHHLIEPDTLAVATEGSAELRAFCDSLAPPDTRGRRLQLFEMSIFDSGPGYAERWLKKRTQDISLDEELQAIRACFEKNATTKRHKGAGQGLPLVVRLLRSKRGFLRLRTGRMSLYQDFSSTTDAVPDAPPQLQAANNEQLKGRPFLRTQGTLLTLLVPLRGQ